MKRGFTMIELIFVIVILGILAAVAIPRIAATRDDAEIAKVATNVNTLMGDIAAYYTSQAKFAPTIKEMTNVAIDETTARTAVIKVAGKDCIQLKLTASSDGYKPSVAVLEKAASYTGTDNLICNQVLTEKGVAHLLEQSKKDNNYTNANGTVVPGDKGIPLSGMRVVR